MKDIDKEKMFSKIREIVQEFFPKIPGEICLRETLSKNCLEIGTPNGSENESFHLCICLSFVNEKMFVPSLCCSNNKNVFNPDPDEAINVDDFENGIKKFLFKSKLEIKKRIKEFHTENAEYKKATV